VIRLPHTSSKWRVGIYYRIASPSPNIIIEISGETLSTYNILSVPSSHRFDRHVSTIYDGIHTPSGVHAYSTRPHDVMRAPSISASPLNWG
jgi:hypothetical protein